MPFPRASAAPGALLVLIVLVAASGWVVRAAQVTRLALRGLVVSVDPAGHRFVVSHDRVGEVMPAMTMTFDVRDPAWLAGVVPGSIVEFTLVDDPQTPYAEGIRIVRYESAEQDPQIARRLKLLTETIAGGAPQTALTVGALVPDFTLVNQANRNVSLAGLRGRVIAVNFIYTSCALPQFCFRNASHFGVLQRRFKAHLPNDLILLTVTFDPERDRPEVLAEYARDALRADTSSWHFLTGDVAAVRRVCDLFGVASFQDEGLMNHSSHTAVIDRSGRLVANIEGNRFTATQLGDLVAATLGR